MTRWVPCAPVILPSLPDERDRCRVADTHPVQGIGGFGAELEHDSMLEVNAAEDSQIHVAEPRSDHGVARHIAIGATRADAPGDAPGPLAVKAAVLNHAVNSLLVAQIRQR